MYEASILIPRQSFSYQAITPRYRPILIPVIGGSRVKHPQLSRPKGAPAIVAILAGPLASCLVALGEKADACFAASGIGIRSCNQRLPFRRRAICRLSHQVDRILNRFLFGGREGI